VRLAYNIALVSVSSHLIRSALDDKARFDWFKREGKISRKGEQMLANQLIVLSGLHSLRIASNDGAPGNEYRIDHSSVKFRTIDANLESKAHSAGKWRTLDNDEIQLHFVLHTPVAEWLDKNLYSPAAA